MSTVRSVTGAADRDVRHEYRDRSAIISPSRDASAGIGRGACASGRSPTRPWRLTEMAPAHGAGAAEGSNRPVVQAEQW